MKIIKMISIFLAFQMITINKAVHKVFNYFHIPEIGIAHAQDSWEEITSNEKIEQFSMDLKTTDKIYQKQDSGRLLAKIQKRGMRSFSYSGNGFKILISIIPDSNDVRIYHAIPSGIFDPDQAFNLGWKKICDLIDSIMDERGIDEIQFYSKEPLSYDLKSVNDTFLKTLTVQEAVRVEIGEKSIKKIFKRTREQRFHDRITRENVVPFIAVS